MAGQTAFERRARRQPVEANDRRDIPAAGDVRAARPMAALAACLGRRQAGFRNRLKMRVPVETVGYICMASLANLAAYELANLRAARHSKQVGQHRPENEKRSPRQNHNPFGDYTVDPRKMSRHEANVYKV
jgi:hypothetical protein